jgi:hypothetical protein
VSQAFSIGRLRAAGIDPVDPRAATAVAAMAGGFAELMGRHDGPA